MYKVSNNFMLRIFSSGDYRIFATEKRDNLLRKRKLQNVRKFLTFCPRMRQREALGRGRRGFQRAAKPCQPRRELDRGHRLEGLPAEDPEGNQHQSGFE